MSYNELTGIVPPSIGALSSLKSLVFSGNDLHGSLPTQGNYLIEIRCNLFLHEMGKKMKGKNRRS